MLKFTLTLLMHKCCCNNIIDMITRNHNRACQVEEKVLASYSFCSIYSSFSEHLRNKILSYLENIY